MLVRTLCALVALPILIAVLILGGKLLYAAVLIISLVGLHEFYKAFSRDYMPSRTIGYLATIALYVNLYFTSSLNALGVIIALLIFVSLSFVVFGKMAIGDAMTTILGFLYVPYMLSHLILISDFNKVFFIWFPFIIAFSTDTFAYLTGKLLGKTKLIPSVSPNKTVEGSLGGVIACLVLSYFYANTFMPEFQFYAIFLGLIGSILSQIGDLIASKMKRIFDIKDFGKIMPGHGGVLDRFDSLIIVLPLVYYFMVLFNYINQI